MVKVRDSHPTQINDELIDEKWPVSFAQKAGLANEKAILNAFQRVKAAELVEPNSPSWIKPGPLRIGLEIANILLDFRLDEDALVAALLYRSVREGRVSLSEVKKNHGPGPAELIDGVLQMAVISQARKGSSSQTDSIRRMLVSLINDVRVALIKIAERTAAIRAVRSANSARQVKVANEVADIYAPLAHRLGVGQLKWELEDLAFRYLEVDSYKKVALALAERREDRERYIEEMVSKVSKAIKASNLEAELTWRVKHIFSIWKKMQRKQVDFSEIYDVRAIRILVDSIQQCYAVLGVIHSNWKSIPHEFDDYIGSPKANGYRSLHTAVIGLGGKVVEIQIRTRSMHLDAEFGVCAHYRYKGTDADKPRVAYEEKIAWLRQILDWHEETGSFNGLEDSLSQDQVDDRIYVFTKDGDVINLPKNSTSLDFAYKVHTEVGHACRGAKINGRIVPLATELKIGDRIEILRQNKLQPSRDWLNPALGYLRTSRARAKVQAWFKQLDRAQNIQAGRQILEQEFRRVAISFPNLSCVIESINIQSVDDLYASIGSGDLRPSQVLGALQRLDKNTVGIEPISKRVYKSDGNNEVRISGVGSLLTQIASCCKPVSGDLIVGYITKIRGVSIHREDCHNILLLREKNPERIIEVSFESSNQDTYSVEIEISAYDRKGLLADVTSTLSADGINVLGLSSKTDKKTNVAFIFLSIEVANLAALSRALDRIQGIANVINTKRIIQS